MMTSEEKFEMSVMHLLTLQLAVGVGTPPAFQSQTAARRTQGSKFTINEERDCDTQDEELSERMTLATNFTSKELLVTFHHFESARDKMLEADPD